MINGIDFSSWSTVKDMHAVLNGQLPVHVTWVRARDGFRDDQKFQANRKLLVGAQVDGVGSAMWGPYSFLGYSAQVGSLSWSAPRGDAQFSSMWSFATAGGKEFDLVAMLDAERNSFIDANNVRQVVPLPSVESYVDTYVNPWIDAHCVNAGRYPIFYSNADIILNYLAPVFGTARGDKILKCPLMIAGYTGASIPPYWERVSKYWSDWLVWQFKGDVKDWPGIDDVDLVRAKGTRAQWKAWCKDATAPLPSEGAVVVTPPPDTGTPPSTGTIDLSGLEAQITALKATADLIKADTAAIKSHFTSSLGVG